MEKAIKEKKGNGTYMTLLAVEHESIMEQLVTRSDTYREEISAWKNKKEAVFDTIPGINNKKTKVNQLEWQQAVAELMNTRYKSAKKIYTDAAKNRDGTAIAAIDIEDGEHVTEKINSNIRFTNAELMAIREAVKMCERKKYGNIVVVTDSKSACEML